MENDLIGSMTITTVQPKKSNQNSLAAIVPITPNQQIPNNDISFLFLASPLSRSISNFNKLYCV